MTESQHDAEQAYLGQVHRRLRDNIQATESRLKACQQDVDEQKRYLWESRDEMDHIEKVASRQSIEQSTRSGEVLLEKRRKLLKTQRTPYFGRFDFAPHGQAAKAVYIGVHHFHDDLQNQAVVYDWRAPIASLFYDYETGPAEYQSPEGTVQGEVHRKRQFRIKYDRIELLIDSTVHVVDEVLQQELGRASDDDGMKNIVATIQRDQNAIIRDDDTRELIIQGVAGSGKTSIALHRIAYLLYRHKDTLSADDILIISPNRVFSSYIANVLPELGEENVREISMEDVASELLEGQYRFESFFEQTNRLLERDEPALKQRLRRKASLPFLKQLNEYAGIVEQRRFTGEDIWIAGRLIPGFLLDEIYRKHRSLPGNERIRQLARETEQKVRIQYNYDFTPQDRAVLKEALSGMRSEQTLRETYKGFFDWAGEPELFRPARNSRLEYADVFPMIYLKMKLDGIRSPFTAVKHLLIDEMQDYTPVQYAVIGRLFNCRKTILGDASQSVNPYNAANAEQIEAALMQASTVRLNKSYRATWEITRFTQQISPNPDLEAIKRPGEPPRVIGCRSRSQEYQMLADAVDAFAKSDHNSLSVICKTHKQAQRLHRALSERSETPIRLLSAESQGYSGGAVVCTAHLAKGLEFDQVLVFDVSAENYHSEMDRNLLYVACTRAMHQLWLTHSGERSTLLPAAVD